MRGVAFAMSLGLVSLLAACSSSDDTSKATGPIAVTIEFLFDISNQRQTAGTFEVTEGADELGSDADTAVNRGVSEDVIETPDGVRQMHDRPDADRGNRTPLRPPERGRTHRCPRSSDPCCPDRAVRTQNPQALGLRFFWCRRTDITDLNRRSTPGLGQLQDVIMWHPRASRRRSSSHEMWVTRGLRIRPVIIAWA